jgi:hypothetical protein
MDNGRLASAWWTLKIAVGLVLCLMGIDKFLNILTNWTDISAAFGTLPVPPELLFGALGVFEVLLGIAILTRWAKLGGYAGSVWLVVIGAMSIAIGRYDVALADLALAAVAFTLARLTPARVKAERLATERAQFSEAGILKLGL